MKYITSINDFKKFLKANKEKICKESENPNDISIDDEIMKDNIWDIIYNEGTQFKEET